MLLRENLVYQNKKTGNYYYIIHIGFNGSDNTPADEQIPLIIYRRTDPIIKRIWARDRNDFEEKFCLAKDINGKYIEMKQPFDISKIL